MDRPGQRREEKRENQKKFVFISWAYGEPNKIGNENCPISVCEVILGGMITSAKKQQEASGCAQLCVRWKKIFRIRILHLLINICHKHYKFFKPLYTH